MRKIISSLLIALTFTVNAQFKTSIPLNPKVKHGTLKNGLTYYVLPNSEPKERASFYIVQKVGAMQEEDSQDGLAHFLEHMAFNGTKHFEGKGIIEYLEKQGAKFGADINAYTSRDQTVYNLSRIPTTRETLIDSCLLILYDWAGFLSLENDEIDNERGVITEEWRTRNNGNSRAFKQLAPAIFNHSKYAERDVIGSMDVIKNFDYDVLKDYYHRWYRPDLQGIVVVGDVDAEEIEKKIIELFSTLVLRDNLPERIYHAIDDNDELLFASASDKEVTSVSIQLLERKTAPLLRDEAYLYKGLLEGLFNSMMSERFSEITRKSDAPALSLSFGPSGLTPLNKVTYVYTRPKEGQELAAFETLMTEVKRVQDFGFTETELNRAKKNQLAHYKKYYNDREKINSDRLAREIISNFLEAEPYPGIEWQYEYIIEHIDLVNLDEINTMIKGMLTGKNQTLTVSGPEKENYTLPTKEELLNVMQKVYETELTAYEDASAGMSLLNTDIVPGSIVSRYKPLDIDTIYGYKLSNGAKVVVFPTTFKKDEISLNSFSKGGMSLLNDEDLYSAGLATSLASRSGLGEHDLTQLKKVLAGKVASVSPSISTYFEGLNGSSSVQDVETMLQLLYLNFEEPRFEEDAYNTIIESWKNALINRSKEPMSAFSDTITLASANYNKRIKLFDQEYIDNANFNKAKEIYKARFSNAADFTFVFVGNIDTTTFLPLVAKYIGGLSSENASEEWVNHHINPVNGKTVKHFKRDLETPKASVYVALSGDMPFSRMDNLLIKAVNDLLRKRYFENIREKEGGTYGVSVRASLGRIPEPKYNVIFRFDCDADKMEHLKSIAWAEFDTLRIKGPDADYLQDLKKSYKKEHNENLENNSHWMFRITSPLQNEENFYTTEEYFSLIDAITPEKVQEMAAKIFTNKSDVVEVVMLPKKNESDSSEE